MSGNFTDDAPLTREECASSCGWCDVSEADGWDYCVECGRRLSTDDEERDAVDEMSEEFGVVVCGWLGMACGVEIGFMDEGEYDDVVHQTFHGRD